MTFDQAAHPAQLVHEVLRADLERRQRIPDLAPVSVFLTIARCHPGLFVCVSPRLDRERGTVQPIADLHDGKVGG